MLFGGWSWIDAYIYSFFLARSACVLLTIPLMTESSASMESLWFAMNRIQNRSSWSSTMCCLRVWVAIHFVHGRMRRLREQLSFFAGFRLNINSKTFSSWKASRNIQSIISRSQFPKIGVPQNGWFIMEIPIKMDDLGYHYFRKHP